MTIEQNFTGTFFLTIVLSKAVSFTFQQGTNISVPVTLNDNSSFFTLPSFGFRYPNGTIYEGDVTVWVMVWDPDNDMDAVSAPGDFTEEGGEDNGDNGLLSAGIFFIAITDSQNNDLEVVDDGTSFQVTVSGVLSLGLPNPILWVLSPDTGLWSNITEMDQLEGDDMFRALLPRPPSRAFYNIDWRFGVCYIKVRAFQTSNFRFDEQLSATRIVAVMYIEGIRGWVFRSSVIANNDGACIRVLCCKSRWCERIKLIAKVSAEVAVSGSSMSLFGADPSSGHNTGLAISQITDLNYDVHADTVIGIRIKQSINGPAFPSYRQCLAQSKKSYHLRFFKEEVDSTIIHVFGQVKSFPKDDLLPKVIILTNGHEIGVTSDNGLYNVTLAVQTLREVIR